MSTLRLFLLNAPLFPGMTIALQVFEDRYRALVAECVQANEPFGIALIREGAEVGDDAAAPYLVGTTAALEAVTPLPDGQLAVTARGVRRFRIVRLLRDRPYPSAEVDYPVDEVGEPSGALREEIAARFVQLRRLQHTIEGGWTRDVRVPTSAGALADAIAATAVGMVEPRQLQGLLETLDVRRRLERAGELLTVVLQVTHQRTQQVVAQRWGGLEREN